MNEAALNTNVGPPEIGQWYARADSGELFQVVGRDEESRAIEIQLYDGDVDEIDAETWSTLPLERSEPPEDWSAPMDGIEPDEIDDSDSAAAPGVPSEPLRVVEASAAGAEEPWEDTAAEEERDPLGEGAPAEPFTADLPEAQARVN